MRDDEQFRKLDGLWRAYRIAMPDPEASPNFMPELWAKIEAARKVSWAAALPRLVSRLLPLAAAATLAMAVYVWSPRSNNFSYVDSLAADLLDNLTSVEEAL